MQLMLWAFAGGLAAPLSPAPGTPIAAKQFGIAKDLDILADFFLPSAPLIDFIQDGCTIAYRTRLDRDAGDQALERELPGIHDRMVAASGLACDRAIRAAITRWHIGIKADWKSSSSMDDIARLAQLLAPATREAQATALDTRKGEMLSDAVKRAPTATPEQEARFQAAMAAFAQTPGGVILINRVSAYQAKLRAENPKTQAELMAIIQRGMAAGRMAANVYARERNFPAPYPDAG